MTGCEGIMTGMFVFAGVESVDPISFEEAKPLLVCRGCLAATRPLQPLEHALAALYGELVGTSVREADILPKFVCSYCRALLLKFKAFRDKCRSSQTALFSLHSTGVPITLDLLPSVATGAPYPNLQKTYMQQVSSDNNVPKHADIPILIIDEHLFQTVHQNGNNFALPKNNIQIAPLHTSQKEILQIEPLQSSCEENLITSVNSAELTNTDTVNFNDLDDDCHDFDDLNEHVDVSDCPDGKKDTKIAFGDHSMATKELRQKSKIKIKDQDENVKDGVLIDCRDSEDSIEDSDMPDCLAGFNSDIYKKDTIISLKDHSVARKLKSKAIAKDQTKDKSLNSDLNLEEIKQWIAKKKANQVNSKKNTEKGGTSGDDSDKNDESGNIVDDKNDVEVLTDATQIISLGSSSDSDDNCLAETSKKLATAKKKTTQRGVNKKKSHKKKNPKDLPFSLKRIKMWIENFKDNKNKVKETGESKKSRKDQKTLFEVTYNSKMILLSKEEQIKQIRARKHSTQYINAVFKCEMCYHTFLSSSTYQNHMAKHDPSQGAFICDVCNMRYANKHLLRKHCMRIHMFEYVCNECGVVTKHREQCVHHYKWHNGKTYDCKICGKSYNQQTTLISHKHKKHGGTSQCSLCDGKFLGKLGLQAHMKLTHKEAIGAVCKDCGVQFHSGDALQRHIAAGDHSHRPCTVCGDSFPNDELLQEHREEKHIEIFKCDLCGKSFDSLKILKNHVHYREIRKLGSRTALGLFICEFCGSSKSSKQTLEAHLRTHTGDKPFECHHCGKCFVSKYILKSHMITKHMPHLAKPPKRSVPPPTLQPTPCRYCDKIFANKHNQLRHENQVHHKMRPFTCDTCGSTHLDKSAMQMHIKTRHLGMPWPKRDRRQRSTRRTQLPMS